MKLNEIRKTCKISQIDIAKKLSVKQSCISFWESGKREPSIELIPKLAEILNCSIEEVVLALIESKKSATKNKSEVV